MVPMKVRGSLAARCVVALACVTGAAAATAEDTPAKMKTYWMVFLRRPAGATADAKGSDDARVAHAALLEKLRRSRECVIEGEFQDDQELRALAVLEVPDEKAARARFAEDPLVTSGALAMDVRPWMGPVDYFRPTAEPRQADRLVFGFLARGPNRSQTKEEAEKLQEGHLAYMGELHKQGKLVMAGPFLDDQDIRGVVVYRVAGVPEAQALAAGDPSVKAGRLVIVARPWTTWKGILP
jgi:uncharacterized protein YciI